MPMDAFATASNHLEPAGLPFLPSTMTAFYEPTTAECSVSKKWHSPNIIVSGDIVDSDTSGVVCDKALKAIQNNLQLHPKELRIAPDSLVWEMPACYEAASGVVAAMVSSGVYDNVHQRWGLGCNLEGQGLVNGFRGLLERLFSHTPGPVRANFIMSRDLGTIIDSDPNAVNKSSPILAIGGQPVSATGAHMVRAPGYNCCTVPVEVRTEKNCSFVDSALILQLAVYARRIFTYQPERKSVCCLLLTENSLCGYQFDHNGFHITRSFNIHNHPTLFVHVLFNLANLVGGTSLDGVFWDKGQQWMRVKPENAEPRFFKVEEVFRVRPDICGRATTCWKVKHPDAEIHYLVKRSWDMSNDRDSEAMLLQSATGLPGVVKIRALTETIVGVKAPTIARVHRLFVTEYYERSIREFRSKRELLYVLRDAIQGHENLWNVGICHRDICMKNIRIKSHDNGVRYTEGTQGILVGLNKAKRVGQVERKIPKSEDATDRNIFQSIHVLEVSQTNQPFTLPDFRDDLESFFYVACFLCSIYKGRKDLSDSSREQIYRTTSLWFSSDTSVSLQAKMVFCTKQLPADYVAPYFGPIFTRMLENMRNWIYARYRKLWNPSLQDFQMRPSESDGHTQFLSFINCAIAEININDGLRHTYFP